jgi:hypothetical protein
LNYTNNSIDYLAPADFFTYQRIGEEDIGSLSGYSYLIAVTTTIEGLKVACERDNNSYETGIEIAEK